MPLLEQEIFPLQGGFNTNYFMGDSKGSVLLRVPGKNPDLFANIVDEYRYIGFTADGGRVKRRTCEEQYYFARNAATEGLLVLPPLELTSQGIVNPFLPNAQNIVDFWKAFPHKKGEIAAFLLHDLYKAHQHGIVYGDRWAGNILIDPTFGVFHIDFDLHLFGNHVYDFEVSQMLYHLVWAGGVEIIPELSKSISCYPNWIDYQKVSNYLKRFAQFFDKTHVGGIMSEIDLLIYTMMAVREK